MIIIIIIIIMIIIIMIIIIIIIIISLLLLFMVASNLWLLPLLSELLTEYCVTSPIQNCWVVRHKKKKIGKQNSSFLCFKGVELTLFDVVTTFGKILLLSGHSALIT